MKTRGGLLKITHIYVTCSACIQASITFLISLVLFLFILFTAATVGKKNKFSPSLPSHTSDKRPPPQSIISNIYMAPLSSDGFISCVPFKIVLRCDLVLSCHLNQHVRRQNNSLGIVCSKAGSRVHLLRLRARFGVGTNCSTTPSEG